MKNAKVCLFVPNPILKLFAHVCRFNLLTERKLINLIV